MAARSVSAAKPPPLRGVWLLAARVGWVALALASLASFVASIPGFYAPDNTPSHSILAGLLAIGWSAHDYITFTLVASTAIVAMFTGMGWLIFVRKSDDRMALLVALFLVTYGVGAVANFGPVTGGGVQTESHLLDAIGGLISYMPLVLFFYLFPSGRFVPGWIRWLALAWVVWSAGYSVLSPVLPAPVAGAIAATLWGSFLVAQVYRYLRVSTPGQRLQTKWVLYGIAAAIAGNLATILLSPDVSTGYGPNVLVSSSRDQLGLTLPALLQGMGGFILVTSVAGTLLLMIPVTLAISILRDRLFDIDVIINRTLVYGSLTAILGAVYVGSILVLQALFRGITGNTSSAALVISTLLIVVLFLPLRSRLQNGIDRAFYREKYDAAGVAAQFGIALQRKVELDDVRASLLQTVEETMHPAHLSLWIRPPTRSPNS